MGNLQAKKNTHNKQRALVTRKPMTTKPRTRKPRTRKDATNAARYDGHASGHLWQIIFFILKSLLRHRSLEGVRLVVDVDLVWRVELAGDINLEVVDDGSEVLVHPINLSRGHDLSEL